MQIEDEYNADSSISSHIVGWCLLIGAFGAALAATVIVGVPLHAANSALIAIGFIAAWRYTWQLIHITRAIYYRRVEFPRRRHAVPATASASHVYVVVLSFRMGPEINAAVYSALIRDLERHGRPATIVACITDPEDYALLDGLRRPGLIRILTLQQSGNGKRDAMERALALLANENPPPGAVVALMDGDTLVTEGTFDRCVPLLIADAAVGALTLDNKPLVSGTALAREWYRLRMRERDLLMCSMSLSRRLLVLTGRFSLFRAEVALSHGFIAMVGQDAIYSWRLGRVGMLTGDDKSTWFYLLRQGWRMIYVPDHAVCCLEKLPRPEFFASTTALMRRYFGNMARNNWRAIMLGPERLGFFTWWSLIDQRISPWTALWGPFSAISLTVFNHKGYLAVYLCWVLLTRTIQAVTFQILSPTFHPLFPLLKFYNQIVGSGLKLISFFHQNQQSWTRQKTGAVAAIDTSTSSALLYMSTMLLAASAMLVAMN